MRLRPDLPAGAHERAPSPFIIAMLTLLAAATASDSARAQDRETRSADDLLIVDCLLPSKV
ncbi:MAG: hypothetical protein ACE5GX_01970, partial [Thermoanaerobaculia bacterium]